MKTVYVVQRVVAGSYVNGGTAVRVFARRAAADKLCRELEAEARRTLSPADALTMKLTQDRKAFDAGLKKLGLEPLAVGRGKALYVAVGAWWRAVLPSLTPEVRAKLWELSGAPAFYEVVTAPLGG